MGIQIRYMRLLIFFDLPTISKNNQDDYKQFRSFLLKNGYYQLQFSVYVKLCINYDELKTKIKQLRKFLPPEGDVRCLQITEKQYQTMKLLVGKFKEQEKYITLEPLIIL